MAISKQNIEEIRSHSDVAEVIGSYLQLKRAGGAYKALCPFHKEKTPSFSVNPQRQIYHCFGCGAGGDVFKFIMEHEGVDFITAAKLLADRAGLHIEFDETDRGSGVKKDVLYSIHAELARDLRTQLLESEEGKAARDYLEERGLGGEIAEHFQLGYSPRQGDRMLAWGKKKGFALADLEQAGVVAQDDEGQHYARFRHRLMFPVNDELGRVIGFSARLLERKENTGKYINSPETPLFHKGRVLYALDKARKPILESRRAIVCEGQIDVIRCHSVGIDTAIAPQGTAMTDEQARVINRYADEVLLVFDADAAGEKAAIRSAEICLAAGMAVRIVSLPPGEDPDSIIRKQGVEAFQELLDDAMSVVVFQLQVMEKSEDLGTEVGVMRAAQAVLESIRHAKSAVMRDQLIQQASTRLKLSETALHEDLERLVKRTSRRDTEPKGRSPKKRNYPYEEIHLAEQLAQHRDLAPLVREFLPLEAVSDDLIRKVLGLLIEHAEDEDADIMSSLPRDDEDLTQLAARIQMGSDLAVGEDFTPERVVQDLIIRIRRNAMDRERRAVKEELEHATADDHARLEAEWAQLTDWLHKLKPGCDWETAQMILEVH